MAVFNSTKALLKDQLNKLNQLTNPDKVLRLAVVTMVPEMKNRIQQDGKKSDGTLMVSPSPQKFGAYSKPYGKKRSKKGRQTGHIDLTDENDMMRDLKPGPTGPNSYGMGFLSSEQHKIAQYNEKHFGITFDPTEQELKQSLVTINKAISSILSK